MESVSLSFILNSNDSFYPDPFLDFHVVCRVCLGSEFWSLAVVDSCMSLICISVLAIEHGHWTDSQYPALLVSWFSDDCSVFPLWNKLLALFHFQWMVCLQHINRKSRRLPFLERARAVCAARSLLTYICVTQEGWQMGSIDNTYLSIPSILAG